VRSRRNAAIRLQARIIQPRGGFMAVKLTLDGGKELTIDVIQQGNMVTMVGREEHETPDDLPWFLLSIYPNGKIYRYGSLSIDKLKTDAKGRLKTVRSQP
jgi:hypothetical protein